jgi:hypothetical protein
MTSNQMDAETYSEIQMKYAEKRVSEQDRILNNAQFRAEYNSWLDSLNKDSLDEIKLCSICKEADHDAADHLL